MVTYTGGTSTDAAPHSVSLANTSRQYPVDFAAATGTAGSSSFLGALKGKLYGYRLTASSTGGTITFADHDGTAIPGHADIIANAQGCPLPVWFGNSRGIPLTNGLSWILSNGSMTMTVYYDHTTA